MKTKLSLQEIYEQGYFLYQNGLYKDAAGIFQLLTGCEAKNKAYWMGLASSLKMEKKYQEAIAAYGVVALLETEDQNPFPHAYAAECFHFINEKAKALEALQAAIKIARKEQKYSSLLIQLQLLNKQWKNFYA